jgi:hypothetical protein
MKERAGKGGANKNLKYSTSSTKNSNSQTLMNQKTGKGYKKTQTSVPGGIIKSVDTVSMASSPLNKKKAAPKKAAPKKR